MKRTKKFPGDLDSVREICAFVVSAADVAGLTDEDAYAVELAVDEACTNIIEHAYRNKGVGNIECSIEVLMNGLKVVLKDQGASFNPDIVPKPDPTLPLGKVKPRGAGLFLMRKLMDEVDFDFNPNNGNILTMVKHKTV